MDDLFVAHIRLGSLTADRANSPQLDTMELGRLVRKIAHKIETDHDLSQTIRDLSGNAIGQTWGPDRTPRPGTTVAAVAAMAMTGPQLARMLASAANGNPKAMTAADRDVYLREAAARLQGHA